MNIIWKCVHGQDSSQNIEEAVPRDATFPNCSHVIAFFLPNQGSIPTEFILSA